MLIRKDDIYQGTAMYRIEQKCVSRTLAPRYPTHSTFLLKTVYHRVELRIDVAIIVKERMSVM